MALPNNGKGPSLRQILDWYDCWLRESRLDKVAAVMGVNPQRLNKWERKYPEFAEAKKLAEERRKANNTFSGYVFKKLSAEAQVCWEHIKFWDGEDSAVEKVEEILSGHNVRVRQELFIHALVHSSFDVSSAMSMVNVSRTQFENWRANDLGFKQLVEEIEWHKKNFFEKALVGLIEEKHPAAVIFANKTINSDRGYNDKVSVEHKHSGRIDIGITIDDLELDLETRKKILTAIRVREAKLAQVDAPKALPEPKRREVEIKDAELVEA